MMRASTEMVLSPPTRSKLCSWTKRRNLVWSGGLKSAISSRKTVPPSAASSRPGLSLTAPVNAPRTWPKSSLSSRFSESVVQLTTTKGPSARRLHRWIWRARTFFPVPLSPDSRMVASLAAAWRAVSSRRRIESIAQDPVFGAQALHLERALDRVSDLVEREGLGHIVERTGLHRGDRTL